MSETYKKITKDGSKVQVESAIRDGEGVKISTNYAKKSEIPAPITVDSSLSTSSTNPVRNSTITNAFYNRMAIAFDTSTTQRYLAIKSGSTSLNQYRDFLVVYSTGDVILLTIQGDNWHAYFIEKKTDLVNKIYQYRQNIAEQYEFLLGIDFTNITETRVNVSIISVSRDAFNGTPSYRTIIGEPTTSTTFSVLTEITPSIPATISDIPTNVSAFTNDAGYLTQHQDISGKENTSNKVTSISSSSTDTQYPSAKCVYSNTVSDITYDSTNKKLQKTKGGTTSDVVTFGANAFTDTTIPTTASDVKALPNYSINIGSTNGGNPRQVKFLSVNYTNYDGNNACFIKLGAMCSHGNGASYTFMDDIFIGVSSSGSVTCNVYKYFQQEVTLDSVTRNYGDVFYTIDTTNKVVDFYILLGQYSTANFTPYTKIGATTTTGITQLSGTPTYYSSGTKVWANGNSTIYARLSDVYPVGSIYMSVENNSPASWIGGTWVQLENRFLLGAGSSYTAGATGGEASHTLTETEMPSHRHSFSRPKSGDKWYSGGSAAWWASPLQTDYTGYTGGGQAHNNMPPYLVVYMWKRTA